MSPRILLIDDHVAIRRGLEAMLTAELGSPVFASAATREIAITSARNARWSLAILDLTLQGSSGLDLIHALKELQPQMAVLVYTMHPEDQFGVRALRAGADGFLTKDSAADEIVHAVRKLLAGGRYISVSLAERLAGQLSGAWIEKPHEMLSDREFCVLQKMSSGKTISDIAGELAISIKTVSTYRGRILEKLGLKSTAELLRYAIENDIKG